MTGICRDDHRRGDRWLDCTRNPRAFSLFLPLVNSYPMAWKWLRGCVLWGDAALTAEQLSNAKLFPFFFSQEWAWVSYCKSGLWASVLSILSPTGQNEIWHFASHALTPNLIFRNCLHFSHTSAWQGFFSPQKTSRLWQMCILSFEARCVLNSICVCVPIGRTFDHVHVAHTFACLYAHTHMHTIIYFLKLWKDITQRDTVEHKGLRIRMKAQQYVMVFQPESYFDTLNLFFMKIHGHESLSLHHSFFLLFQ